MNKIYAFTFAELMISLVIISVITALLYPTISELAPNNNEYLYKSAYRTVENVVADIIAGNNHDSTGEHAAMNNAEANRVSGEMPTTAQIVCQYFQAKLNQIPLDTGGTACAAGSPYLQTSNGVRWYFERDGDNTIIFVDVNSSNNKSGNSTYETSPAQLDDEGNVITPAVHCWEEGSFGGDNNLQDTFAFVVSKRGKITVSDYGLHYLKDDANN